MSVAEGVDPESMKKAIRKSRVVYNRGGAEEQPVDPGETDRGRGRRGAGAKGGGKTGREAVRQYGRLQCGIVAVWNSFDNIPRPPVPPHMATILPHSLTPPPCPPPYVRCVVQVLS